MSETIFNPALVTEIENQSKPALLSVSKMNISFNNAAVSRLAIKQGVRFILHLKDGKIFYKDAPLDGFEIKTVNHKGAQLLNKGLYIALNKKFKPCDSSYRFIIGEFKDGARELTLEE
ncbi:MAG: hypothetical protein FD170_3345 [Bacteroidetes bacterium]|nr:MAG: hypothetical protein FD170_3345 [Bacteroidota bacterium]